MNEQAACRKYCPFDGIARFVIDGQLGLTELGGVALGGPS